MSRTALHGKAEIDQFFDRRCEVGLAIPKRSGTIRLNQWKNGKLLVKMKHLADRPKLNDCAFLFGIVLLSALPYLSGPGFHGDDWSHQAEFAKSADQSLGEVFLHEWTGDSDAFVRPVIVASVVLSYKAFGQHAMPSHLVNTAGLGLTTVLLYLALNELRLGRWLAFVIALLFGLLPHYSTDRFGSLRTKPLSAWPSPCSGYTPCCVRFGKTRAVLQRCTCRRGPNGL